MGGLLAASAFFSASEAAFFFLGRSERRKLAAGNQAQRVAAGLLYRPEQLLSTILFGNLVVNLTYFTLDSMVSLRLQHNGHAAEAGFFALGSLLAIILLGEMLPKTLAVLAPRLVAASLAVPLAGVVRPLSPLLPLFDWANLLSRRLLWPNFQAEPYLHVSDLERAVRLSTADATFVEQEQRVLERIVWLSEIPVDELMRPRLQLQIFRPPVSLADLGGRQPASGYLLISESDSDEVQGAVPLRRLPRIPAEHLEQFAEPVVYVPWCTTAARALEIMRRQQRRVAAVINEYGETIGILPMDDIGETLFSRTPSRSERLLHRQPIRQVGEGVWQVTGMTSVRRLLRQFPGEGPATQSGSIGGVVQEVLQRLPQPGDECDWGRFHLKVLEVPARGQVLLELTLMPQEAE